MELTFLILLLIQQFQWRLLCYHLLFFKFNSNIKNKKKVKIIMRDRILVILIGCYMIWTILNGR